MDKQQLKVLAAQACVHTAACLVEDYLQGSEFDIYREKSKSPSKLIKDILSARSKLNDCCDRLLPEFSSQQTDFLNQVSYILEDVIKEIYNKNYASGESSE